VVLLLSKTEGSHELMLSPTYTYKTNKWAQATATKKCKFKIHEKRNARRVTILSQNTQNNIHDIYNLLHHKL
jgi:hypothetical protein